MVVQILRALSFGFLGLMLAWGAMPGSAVAQQNQQQPGGSAIAQIEEISDLSLDNDETDAQSTAAAAEEDDEATGSSVASESAKTASLSAEQQEEIEQIIKEDVTQPEQPEVRDRILLLFEQRPIQELSFLNVFGYAVQYAVGNGVPANTIVLILLLPFLATMIAFVRHVVGFPSLGLIVPIALSITLVATGITAGIILSLVIILGSTLARMIVKKIRIMQLPKVALSMFIVSILIFLTLLVTAKAGTLVVRQLSIFPVLLLILLSEQVVNLQLDRSLRDTIGITVVTYLMGLAGYVILSTEAIRDMVLLYPELTLLLIPANFAIGRYFGLRWTEYFRFTPIRHAGN